MALIMRVMYFLGFLLFMINSLLRIQDGRTIGGILCGIASLCLLFACIFSRERVTK